MNTMATLVRMSRRRGATVPTSRPAHGLRRVNPQGNLDYMVRTMARPRESYVLTEVERNRIQAHEDGWLRNLRPDPAFQSDFLDWRDAVEKYAEAKRLSMYLTMEESYLDRSHIFRWRTR